MSELNLHYHTSGLTIIQESRRIELAPRHFRILKNRVKEAQDSGLEAFDVDFQTSRFREHALSLFVDKNELLVTSNFYHQIKLPRIELMAMLRHAEKVAEESAPRPVPSASPCKSCGPTEWRPGQQK